MLLQTYEQQFPLLVDSLRTAALNHRLGHAYILHGDNPEVRSGFAMAFAQMLLCPEPAANGGACGVCKVCCQIADNAYPELVTLMPSSKSRIIPIGEDRDDPDTVRWFEYRFHLKSATASGRKVGIIYDADRMQPQGQNAFLKTLEEPPRDTFFLLASGNPSSFLPTIRSRCQLLSLLTNRCHYGIPGLDDLLRTLNRLQFHATGSLPEAETCCESLLNLADSLRKNAEETVTEKWSTQLKNMELLDSATAKKIVENRFKAATQAEYLNYRGMFLSAIHTWFAQVHQITCGVNPETLEQSGFLPFLDPKPGEDCEPAAFRALEQANKLLQNLHWTVDERLVFRDFCFAVALNNKKEPRARNQPRENTRFA